MQHERETLEAVVSARNQAANELQAARTGQPGGQEMERFAAAEGLLHNALGIAFPIFTEYIQSFQTSLYSHTHLPFPMLL